MTTFVHAIDADSHIVEPRDTWSRYIDPRYADRALRIEDEPVQVHGVHGRKPHLTLGGNRLFEVAGISPQGTAHFEEAGEHARVRPTDVAVADMLGDIREALFPYEDGTPRAGWDPAHRLQWMDDAGLSAGIIFPTWGLMWEQFLGEWPDVVCANMRAYNRWIGEFCAEAPDRMFPVGQLSLLDPGWAIQEVERLAAVGFRVCNLRPVLFGGKPIAHDDFERFWAALEHHDMSLAFHIGAFGWKGEFFDEGWYAQDRRGPGNGITNALMSHVPAMITLTAMIRMGVFARHPGLRVGVFELGAGWVHEWIDLFDRVFHIASLKDQELASRCPELPSEYLNRNVWISVFEYENLNRIAGDLSRDRLVFASDYPHPESYERPLEGFERSLRDAPEALHPRLLRDNALAFLGSKNLRAR